MTEKNLALRREREAEKRKDPEYRAKVQAAQKGWRDANPKRVTRINRRSYEKHKEKILDAHSQWKSENRDRVRASNDRTKLRQSLLKEPETIAARAASLRWDGLFRACLEERRREAMNDCRDQELLELAAIWFT